MGDDTPPPAQVAELGAGTGIFTRYLAGRKSFELADLTVAYRARRA
jgi:phospholipid N-methyltransferase